MKRIEADSAGAFAGAGAASGDASLGSPPWRRSLDPQDWRAVWLLVAWSALVVAVVASVILREAETLAFPVARILFEDHFLNVGIDGRMWPIEGETVTPAFAVLVIAPLFWLHQMSYFPLADLVGSTESITIGRLVQLVLYQVGTPLVYRLLRYGKADRWVAFALAAAYAISPFSLTRMLVCNSLTTAQFIVWSEIGRIEGRPVVRALGLMAATFSYPLAGFPCLLLCFQDWYYTSGRQRRSAFWVMVVMIASLAMVHVGVLGLWKIAQPTLAAEVVTFDDNLNYPVFPYRLPRIVAMPVKWFEIAVFIGGACAFLLVRPRALFPAIVDLVYCGFTNKGIRDHSTCLTTLGVLYALGVRASLFVGGSIRRNRILVGGALFATVYGHALAGPNGLIALGTAPDPPRPHLEDIAPCVPPGQQRCLVQRAVYSGFVGLCQELDIYKPEDLDRLRIDDPGTVVFITPGRIYENPKGRPYDSPEKITEILGRLGDRIRAGQLSGEVCEPGMVLVRAPGAAPTRGDTPLPF